MEVRAGDRFGRYRVVRLLGRGGMGVVYEAADDAIGRGVALKVLNADMARDDPTALERFRREARAAGAINDPRVVTLLGVETAGPRVALAFELVPGGSLEELRVRSGGRLPWAEAARLGAELARGLAVIHQAGLVHRDVKPHNALLDAAGCLKVSDLGLVRSGQVSRSSLSATGELVGTHRYLAPEAQEEAPVGPPADVYGLGVTLFQLLTGQPPFQGEGFAILKQHAFDAPPAVRPLAPDVPQALEALVLRLLAKEPGARGSATQVANELDALRRSPARGRRRRRRSLWLAGVAACALGLGLGVAVTLGRSRPPEPDEVPPPPPPPPSVPMKTALVVVAEGRVDHPQPEGQRARPFGPLTLTSDGKRLVLGGYPGRYETWLVDAQTLQPLGGKIALSASVADPLRPKLIGFTPRGELVRVPLDDPDTSDSRRELFTGPEERSRFIGATIAIDVGGDVLYAAWEGGPPDPVDVFGLEFRNHLVTIELPAMSVGRVLASAGGRAYLAFHQGDRRERNYQLLELKRDKRLRALGRCVPLAATPVGDLVVLCEYEGTAPKRLSLALEPTTNAEANPRTILHDRKRDRIVVAIDDPFGAGTRLIAVQVRQVPQ